MQRFSSLPNAKAHGFTLLEVMVALTITLNSAPSASGWRGEPKMYWCNPCRCAA